jgi:glutamine amidotransferase
MGWNTLDVVAAGRAAGADSHALLDRIRTGPGGLHAYFVHSFHLAAADPRSVVATTDYGGAVTALVARDNMAGTQFHPEKSQCLGLMLIANFLRWRP